MCNIDKHDGSSRCVVVTVVMKVIGVAVICVTSVVGVIFAMVETTMLSVMTLAGVW